MTENQEVPLISGIVARFRKLVLPSQDSRDYDRSTPSRTPDATETGISIDALEKIYQTNALGHKAVDLRTDRMIGAGFELESASGSGVDETLSSAAKEECWKFLLKIGYLTFFRQSVKNALVSGNEWTEMIYNLPQGGDDGGLPRRVMDVSHGDFRTIDFRRSLQNNKILLDLFGKPVGYWQKVEDLAEIVQSLQMLYGSQFTFANMKAAKERLDNPEVILSQDGREVAVLSRAFQYMFLDNDEIVHLSFDNLNDSQFGQSMFVPAYNALTYLDVIMNSSAEAVKEIGYPKPVIYVGDADHPPNDNLNDLAEEAVTDPVRKESFVLPYYCKLEYLHPAGLSGDLTAYFEPYLNLVAAGLKTPKEMLLGDGSANRATAMAGGSDYEKGIEADRKILEEYILEILNIFLIHHGYGSTSGGRCPYLPSIKWPEWITEDQALRERMTLEKWQAGLITFTEAREALELPETEDERKKKYYDEIHALGGGTDAFPNTSIDHLGDLASSVESTEPDASVRKAMFAQFALDEKSKINPALDSEFRTRGIDYKKIARENVGTKIKTVGPADARRIRDVIVNGLARGSSLDSIRSKIKSIGDYSDSHANMILRTELSNLRSSGREASAQSRGMEYKQWQAVMDAKTSNLSKALHGQVRKIDEEFSALYTDENGKPQKWSGMVPPEHPRSRCSLIYYGTDPRKVGLDMSDAKLAELSSVLGALNFAADDLVSETAKVAGLPKGQVETNLFGLLNLSAGAENIIRAISKSKSGNLSSLEKNKYAQIANSIRGKPNLIKTFFGAAEKVLVKKKYSELSGFMKTEGVE